MKTCYLEGFGVEKNERKANVGTKILEFCKLGDKYALGIDVERNEKLAFEFYEEAAKLGDWGAAHKLADAYCYGRGVEQNREKALEIANQIHEKDPSFEVEEIPVATASGCYVATAVYGSYDCPEVWTLRRYRDYDLAETWYGRAFIHTYYAVSPTLVKWFGHTDWFRNMWRGKLDRMVNDLRSQGYEDTPYDDRVW